MGLIVETLGKGGGGLICFEMDDYERLFLVTEGLRAAKFKDQGLLSGIPSLAVHEVRNHHLLGHTTETGGEVFHLLVVDSLLHSTIIDVY